MARGHTILASRIVWTPGELRRSGRRRHNFHLLASRLRDRGHDVWRFCESASTSSHMGSPRRASGWLRYRLLRKPLPYRTVWHCSPGDPIDHAVVIYPRFLSVIPCGLLKCRRPLALTQARFSRGTEVRPGRPVFPHYQDSFPRCLLPPVSA